ncbi:lytic transglycosylase [Gardnerella vaginalis]|uniref:Lytic transglycosylase n=1 Tax=Gardnerella vaginalis TaxID=2702 RepID=A0A3E1IZH9_GARVA|nr:G5 domain-containing protein [Gardnerella vaginalis]RFD78426.1 lytic transglycosylase [Gardnerella vaginalis]
MARRWTPRRLIVMRRARILACVLSLSLAATSTFAFTAQKSVALVVNGKTRIVKTYATTSTRLLEEQRIPLKTHDQVISSSGEILTNHATVTVRSAYQTSITVDGVTIPFWTVATSIDQLIGFFKANARKAARITVNLRNIYDQLTCGLSINKKGPITVIADGKARIAPDGTLPASAILDSQGIVLGKEDRVSVEENDGTTILRVARVTHGKETRTVSLPFATQTIVDPKLPANARVVQQAGVNGEREDVYNVTYVDGKAESATLIAQNIVKPSINEVVAVGKSAPKPTQTSNHQQNQAKQPRQPQRQSQKNATTKNTPRETPRKATQLSPSQPASDKQAEQAQQTQPKSAPSDKQNQESAQPAKSSPASTSTSASTSAQQSTQAPAQSSDKSSNGAATQQTDTQAKQSQQSSKQAESQENKQPNPSTMSTVTTAPAPAPNPPAPAPASNPDSLVHATPEQAKLFAQGAAAQMGWTGKEWEDLVWLWNRESGWRWNAENPSSHAYGIPQALPANKMSSAGANWHEDAAVQISWGLSYIKNKYGSPSGAVRHSKQIGWY